MAFDRQFLDELIARNDIVDVVSNYVSLQPRGGSLWGCCPFHSEKTPSFHVLPDKQLCYCFGCKKGGGVINFIMEEENLSFPDAVRFLARRANMPVPEEEHSDESRLRSRILSLNRDAARFYYDQLYSPKGVPVLEYMKNRKITRRNATNFGLGASADEWDGLLTAMRKKGYGDGELLASGLAIRGKNGGLYDKFRKRLIFPIIDVRGDVLGFGGRIISKDDPGAKYMNTPETIVYSKRRVLYGLNLAKKSKRSNIILVEGNIDVVMLHQAGFDNACASMGTALTTEQLQLLSRYTKEIVLCYDNDDAGKVATQKALTLLNNTDCSSSPSGSSTESTSNRTRTTSSSSRVRTPLSICFPAARAGWTSAWRSSSRSSTSKATRDVSALPKRQQDCSPQCRTRLSAKFTPCARPRPQASRPTR